MLINQHKLSIATEGRGTLDLTPKTKKIISASNIMQGICQIFLTHTSASLILCENADPTVRDDLEKFFVRLIPDGDPLFQHTAEGPDDMPAHIRTILTQNSLNIPIYEGKLALGTWQGIYLWEHRIQPQHRQLIVTLMGL